MKRILVLAVAALIVLVVSAPVQAKGPKHGPNAAASATFTCDGTTCIFTVTGLAASDGSDLCDSTCYQASIAFSGADGKGCHLGISAQPTDPTGSITFVAPEARVKCGLTESGTVTAWARAGNSGRFGDPPVLLLDGQPAITEPTPIQ